MRFISYALILLGIAAMAAPKLMEWRADRELDALLREAERHEAAAAPLADTAAIDGYLRVSRLLGEESGNPEEAADAAANGTTAADATAPAAAAQDAVAAEADAAGSEAKRPPQPQPIATIEIASIGVKLPVLEGATEANMAHSAAHMSETAPLGEIGNAAIAAHRARTKGRLFNRLDEVAEGDEIVIRSEGRKYVYTVFKRFVVEPDDVSVLNKIGDEKLLTLITCDPVVNATHRLIVQARME
ncbi:class D sortase [Paenibacillus sp. GYB003]|uniref:class D sortase n=1 Tax=Paenibacillus sp. GYB003 TaxID=2994392 RepID=UPI002F964184